MPTKKQIQPGEKVPFKLTATERKLVLEGLMCLDQEYEQIIRDTPAGKPVMLTLDDLEDFSGYIAAEAGKMSAREKCEMTNSAGFVRRGQMESRVIHY